MGKRQEIAAVTVLVFVLTSAGPAQADPSPSPSATADTYKSLQEQYKLDRNQFIQAVKDREFRMRIINAIFKNSVDKANADARAAMANALTPEQKTATASARRNSIALAITLRDEAILALGPFPTPPTKPEKFSFEKNEYKMGQKSKSRR
jgi:hypothetical protein